MKLQGIIPPMVTPLRGRDELDCAGLERLVEHMLEGGVHGLFILGTSGEAPSLSYRLRRELIARVCEQVHGRIPVLVGVTDTAFVETLNLARSAADAGAAAVVLSTPYYFPEGQPELSEYLEDLVPQLPLPVMLYNMPSMTKVVIEPDTLKRVAHLPGIAGIKDSGGDLDYFSKLLKLREQRPDWSVLIGPEHLLVESVKMGGDGGVSGGANMFPKIFVQGYQALVEGDEAGIQRFAKRIKKIQPLYAVGRYPSQVIKGMKCALSVLEICDDFMAEPFHRFRQPERERIEQTVEAILTMEGNPT